MVEHRPSISAHTREYCKSEFCISSIYKYIYIQYQYNTKNEYIGNIPIYISIIHIVMVMLQYDKYDEFREIVVLQDLDY